MILEQRALVAMLIAMGVGTVGVHAYPVDRANVYLQIIELRNPTAFLVLVYGYMHADVLPVPTAPTTITPV